MRKLYHWVCNCCKGEFVLNTSYFSDGGDIPWGEKLEYKENSNDAEPRNICKSCALDAVIWAGKKARRGK